MKPTDVQITAVRFSYEHCDFRSVIKFGGMTMGEVTLLNAECDLVTRNGQRASGYGSMPRWIHFNGLTPLKIKLNGIGLGALESLNPRY